MNNKAIVAAKSALKTTRYFLYFSMVVNIALAGALMYTYFGKKCDNASSSVLPSIGLDSAVVTETEEDSLVEEEETESSAKSLASGLGLA